MGGPGIPPHPRAARDYTSEANLKGSLLYRALSYSVWKPRSLDYRVTRDVIQAVPQFAMLLSMADILVNSLFLKEKNIEAIVSPNRSEMLAKELFVRLRISREFLFFSYCFRLILH